MVGAQILRRVLPFSIAAATALILTAVVYAGPYPSPLPDFAHPGSPHDPLYSPTGGNLDRPVLVIYASFSDTPRPAGFDAAYMANRFFGPMPSVADYYDKESFGGLTLTPAAESDSADGGAVNDGIVEVSFPSTTKSTFTSMSDGAQNKALLQAADPFVNFAAFDTNGNGTVEDREIIVERMDADADPLPAGCGGTRGEDPVTLDGKNMAVSVAGDGTDTNLITIIHETGHAALHTRDLYGFGVGSFDLYGPTCTAPDATFFSLSSWQKLHLGWITPTIVTKDGFYSVPRWDTSGQAFLLYDPDKGTNDYFLVENRERPVGTYDASASDRGLVIWRIDDAQYASSDETVRPIDIMRPDGTRANGCMEYTSGCYGGSDIDAWDPSDPNTPQRTMARTWRDGSAANVAVRAIDNRSDLVRAYFDVRGPGVLVDTYTLNAGPPPNVTPDESNAISVPVMNTGEATDTFAFTITGLPPGWSATTNTQTLGAGVGSTATIQLTPDANAATGIYTLNAKGTSTTDGTVTSSCSVSVNVVLDQTQISYTGATSKPTAEPAGFAALVSDPDDAGSPPVPSVPVTFNLGGGALIVTASTTLSGIATASPILTLLPGTYTLVVSTPRVGKHAPATISLPYTVERRPTTLLYTGVTAAEYSDPAVASAILTDSLSGMPLTGKPVGFTLGSQSAPATTGGSGTASATIVITQAAGTVTVGAAFAGDTIYLPSSDSKPFVIDKEDLAFVYTGDTLVAAPETPVLRSVAAQESDGFPGDLALAQASFHLVPTLTPTSFDYVSSVDAAGHSSVAATGLPVDVWTVTISVPASNAYWEGSSASPAELVLVNPARQVTGGGSGLDSADKRATLELSARYQGTTPTGVVQLRSSAGRFMGRDLAWIVVSVDQAILQLDGTMAGAPATLRLRLRDGGEPGAGHDTFDAMLGGYDSGTVSLDRGNLKVH
jgi:M6 family metalloprotease-like protein